MKRLSLLLLVVLLGACKERYYQPHADAPAAVNPVVSTETSDAGCCVIVINHRYKTVSYITDLGTDAIRYSSPEDMESTINAMREFCYGEHTGEY